MEIIRAAGQRVFSAASQGVRSLAEMFHVSKRNPRELQDIANAAQLRQHIEVTKAEIIKYLLERGHNVVMAGARWCPCASGPALSDYTDDCAPNVVCCPPNSTEPDRMDKAILVRREKTVTERLLFTCMTERPVETRDIDAVAAMLGGWEVVFIVQPNVPRIAEDAKDCYDRLGITPDEL